MIGKIDSVEKSKSGKSWRVKVGGKYYGAKFDSHLEKEVGKTIDFNVESGEYGDWIVSWAHTQSAAPANGGDHEGLSDTEMRFISNVVGQAILAKTVSDPLQISLWAKAARQTLRELA